MKILPLILFFVVNVGAVPTLAAQTNHVQLVASTAHISHSLKKIALADANHPPRLMNATAFQRGGTGDFLAGSGGLGPESIAFSSNAQNAGANESAANGVDAFPPHSGLMSVQDLLLMLLVLVGLVAFQLRRAHDSLQRPFTNS